ncbi:hypothetical protein GCM10022220_16640 [Actinocatenispora rupis]|uniref:Uncharacterized protein n=1 Tax=Actinocatenispora rupis TaxID=519421 RepID=A0A8J3J8Q6_9ACTN|nr:hypothetical protein Aru02nite_12870 [Actinocatenispora rupis]
MRLSIGFELRNAASSWVWPRPPTRGPTAAASKGTGPRRDAVPPARTVPDVRRNATSPRASTDFGTYQTRVGGGWVVAEFC